MTFISGLHNLTLQQDQIWVAPYTHATLGEISYYENPCIHGARSFVDEEAYVQRAKDNMLSARVVGFCYERKPWHNASFDYNAIYVANWPEVRQPSPKRRNEFKKVRVKAEESPVGVNVCSLRLFLEQMPLLRFDDSTATSFIPMLESQASEALPGNMFPITYHSVRTGAIIGLGIVEHIENVLFNYALVRRTEYFTASDLTYALCGFAHAVGASYLDVWNVALSQREGYKRTFFTDPIQGYCWASPDVIEKHEWMHSLE
jgi:hypothetical protein